MVKDRVAELKCKCGHDVMLHGYYNMGCSVIISDPRTNQEHKCPCNSFQEATQS